MHTTYEYDNYQPWTANTKDKDIWEMEQYILTIYESCNQLINIYIYILIYIW